MEQKHHSILRQHWSYIRDNLEPNNILPRLVLVLRETDKEEIREQSTRQERCDKLLCLLPRGGKNAFNVFVEALKKEAPHLALVLIEAEKGTENELSSAREQSVELQAEVRKLKRESKKEKHYHKMLYETLKPENQELAKIIQQQRGE